MRKKLISEDIFITTAFALMFGVLAGLIITWRTQDELWETQRIDLHRKMMELELKHIRRTDSAHKVFLGREIEMTKLQDSVKQRMRSK